MRESVWEDERLPKVCGQSHMFAYESTCGLLRYMLRLRTQPTTAWAYRRRQRKATSHDCMQSGTKERAEVGS